MAAPGRQKDRVFLKHTYTTKRGAGQAHVRYIAFRSRELVDQERGVFDQWVDHANAATFNAGLNHRLTQHPKVPVLHKLVVSWRQDQWDRAGFTSWKPITRMALLNFEKATGKRLSWVAAEHLDKGHPHVHIAIAGVYKDATGKDRRLRLDMKDIKLLRAEFQRIYDRERHPELDRELDREQHELDRSALARTAGGALQRIAWAVQQADREHEYERQRQREQDFRGR